MRAKRQHSLLPRTGELADGGHPSYAARVNEHVGRDAWYVGHFSRDAAEAVYQLRVTTDPLIALRALGTISAEADRVTRECVADLRAQGASWTQIAEALGVTRQAVQRRFSA